MVVVAALVGTAPPGAEVAVGDRIGVRHGFLAQRLEERLLVPALALEEQLRARLCIVLSRNLATVGKEIEVRPVLAAQEVVERARREERGVPSASWEASVEAASV